MRHIAFSTQSVNMLKLNQ